MLPGVTVIPLSAGLDVGQVLAHFRDDPFVIVLDSAARIRVRDARYSFLSADPVATTRLDRVVCGDRPFELLREWQTLLPEINDASTPPFCGGIAGLMSYELGEAFERLPRPGRDDFGTPAMLAGLFDWCLVWDHIDRTVQIRVLRLRSGVGNEDPDLRYRKRLEWVQARVRQIESRSDTPSTESGAGQDERNDVGVERHAAQRGLTALEHVAGVYSDFRREQYIAAVDRVVEYIRAGDIFQANLSQQLTAGWGASPETLYRRVRQRNPAPFCGFLKTPEFSIVSASPERFLKVRGGRFVETRPIKGTRRRQRSPIADLYTTDELTSSPKDRAENVMIVDLLRNDLSRSCRSGTVRVTGLCEVELFETVQHLVSTVEGQLHESRDLWDLCAGCFPGGSVTGAPKIRAMQIIAELEPTVRGAYCGSLFYAGPRGDFDSSILIRTFTLRNGLLRFPVGGGIVADSDAEDEYRETLHKASGMLRVLASEAD